MRAWWTAGLGLLALTALACGAQAAVRIDRVELPPDPILPDAQVVDATAVGVVDCVSVMLRREPGTTGSVRMEVELAGEDGVLFTAAEQVDVDPGPCGSGQEIPVSFPFQVSLTTEPDALVPIPASVTWRLPASALDAHDSPEGSVNFTVQAAPLLVPLTSVVSQQATVSGGNVTWRIRVENAGNVGLRVSGSAVTEVVGGSAGGTATVSRVDLARGASEEVLVSAPAPKGDWARAYVRGNLTLAAAVGPAQERAVPFELLVVREGGKDSPAPAAWLAAAAAIAAAAGRRAAVGRSGR